MTTMGEFQPHFGREEADATARRAVGQRTRRSPGARMSAVSRAPAAAFASRRWMRYGQH